MPRDPLTQGEATIKWIEDFCVRPDGRAVRLTAEQRALCYSFYDAGQQVPIAPPLSGYLVLYHLVGPAAKAGHPPPATADAFSVWTAAGPLLRSHLTRSGARITCRALGTSWSSGSVAACDHVEGG
jgi:hypothetical protein